MRIKSLTLPFCPLLFFLSCSSSGGSEKHSYLHSLVDSLSLNKSKNIVLYTINPNDCLSCLNGFKIVNNDFSNITNARIYVIAVDREVEKREWLKTIKGVNLENNADKKILWSKNIFQEINRSLHKNLPLSLVCVYNYKLDSVIYSKSIREISDEREFRAVLGKKF
ncbi:MAG TPA: hypothetical protein VGC65_03135 [Bacteroidia bacterium]|jgi:hypothetical protein